MNIIGNLLYNLPPPIRKIYRKIENISKKIINNQWSQKFNTTCLNENLWPTYSIILKIIKDYKIH